MDMTIDLSKVDENKTKKNISVGELVECIIKNGEGVLTNHGAVLINTGEFTGRSPKDRYIVRTIDRQVNDEIWWGEINQPLEASVYEEIFLEVRRYLGSREVYIQDVLIGADQNYRVPLRIVSEKAWADLFSWNIFRRISPSDLVNFQPEYTIFHCPNLQIKPAQFGTRTGTFIILNLETKVILIGGTEYAGEIKKAVFSILNYLMPKSGVLPMHCSANVGPSGDVALFFGLSGTGKTTLSSDPDRSLIGDDEHGWSDQGVFNFEGGCYAKVIRLRQELEPLIWDAVHQFGSILENVVCDPDTRGLDFDNDSITENTRATYPLHFIQNYYKAGQAGHPSHIFFLTADAFGVLPPLARLASEQIQNYFLSGYTSKLAGTERELGLEPVATFSACFGAPFLPLFPKVYADMLLQKVHDHHTQVWLVNTGWTGGPYGIGHRMDLGHTRAIIHAVLDDKLKLVEFYDEPIFNLQIPFECPGVPSKILNPVNTWRDAEEYQQMALRLSHEMQENHLKCFG